MFSKQFLLDMAERAVKTFCQFIVAQVGIILPTGGLAFLEVNWIPVLISSMLGAGLSIVTSIGSSLKGDENSASLIK